LTAGDKSYDAFLYNGTTTIDLGTLGGTINGAIGLAINDSGEVVGQSQLAAGGEHAFLYDGSSMLDLNNLIAATDPLYDEVLFYSATGINDSGQIVANGCYMSGPLNGQCHAFRLDPVPVFAGTPGKANCHGQSVAALASQFGGLNGAAAALGFSSVAALQNAILIGDEGDQPIEKTHSF
jgi:probable HAF family extracellular repeat protein